MSEVPEDIGPEEFHDTTSESDDNVSLSDPGSDTDVGDTGSEEDFIATDRVAEEVYKDPQPDSDADSAHAAHHEQEVEAYLERSRSQAVPGRLPSLPDLPQVNVARIGQLLDDTDIEPAGDNTDTSMADNGHSTSENGNTDTQAAASETVVGDNGHSTSADVNADIEPAAPEQQSESGVLDNGQSTDADAETAASNAESASGQEQPAEVPALTAETQPDAVLPSIEAVTETAEAPSEHESEPEYESIPEPESEHQSLPDPEPESERLREQETQAAQSSEAADSDGDDERSDADLDVNITTGQQPPATRPDFAEIQRVLGQAASQGSNGSTESHSQATESAPRSAPEDAEVAVSEPAQSTAESGPEDNAQSQTVQQQIQSEDRASLNDADGVSSASDSEDGASGSAPAVTEPASSVAASGSEATASRSPERAPTGGLKRLPSLPVRRGAPSLPSRNTSAPTPTEQPRAEPTTAAPSGNGAPSPLRPSAPVSNNGHRDAATPSGNGHGTPSTTSPSNASTSTTVPAANPSAARPPSGSAGPSIPARPAGSANPSIPPRQPATATTPSTASNGQPAAAAAAAVAAAAPDEEPAEHRELREKVQNFRVLLVQLTMRLGQSMRGSIVQQVNYRLDLAERIRIPQTSSSARRSYGFETAIRTAEEREAVEPGAPLPFACTVMVMGMTGVGKSATINSVLDEDEASPTNAFEPATKGVKEITGTVAGVRVKFIDTPGLQPSAANIGSNQRLLNQMHRAFKKHKPDIMLYMDRADVYRTDAVDVPLLRAITETFGPNIWFNTILALTHAAAAPPDGNAGPLTYDTYTRSCTQGLQNKIRNACGDNRLLNPVALVENHPACRKNDKGWGILPNQMVWKPHLILLLLSSKLLAQTDSLLKIHQSTGDAGRAAQAQAMRMLLGGSRKMPPIPYLIANFIQKKSPRKHPDEERQFKHDSELKDLTLMERKEQMRLRREYSRMRSDDAKAEAGASQTGTPAPDIPLQPTFDAENNSHRYRYMEPPPDAALCRPVMEPNGFDHDDGMNAFSVDKSTVIRKRGVYVGGAPAYLMAQVQKDRDLFSVVSEAEASYYHTHKLITTASLDGQTVQSDALFTGKLETRFKNHPKNRTGAGILVSRLKEDGGLPTKGPLVYGAKVEDRFKPTDKVKVLLASATLMNKPERHMPREQAWNHSLETRIKAGDDDRLAVTVGLSNMRYRGKSQYGGNLSSQYAATPGTTVMGNLQLNNERAGKMTLRVSSHDYPQLGFSLLVPVVTYIWGRVRGHD